MDCREKREDLEKDKQSLRRVVKLPRNTQVRLAIISSTGYTRNNKYIASYSSEEMMHEINVIRGPGGCFSLFVNVPHAEYLPRAVSTGPRIIGSPSCRINW